MTPRPGTESASDGAPALTDPPADSPSGPAGGRSARRSEYVEALVEVALDPAVGLAARVFDPLGDDPQGLDRCRTIAMEAITSVALHRSGRADASVTDDHVREVMARVAEASLEALIGHGGTVAFNPDCGLERRTPVRFAVLQDVTSAMRRVDRRVTFMVLAAGISPKDARALLGVDEHVVNASLRRVARRLEEAEPGTLEVAR
ncbi:MAG: hypothetical protein M9942_11860 [Microthrixaceae bacterium]|nr:hypothetical protein [Microthrixaceae bacterium]